MKNKSNIFIIFIFILTITIILDWSMLNTKLAKEKQKRNNIENLTQEIDRLKSNIKSLGINREYKIRERNLNEVCNSLLDTNDTQIKFSNIKISLDRRKKRRKIIRTYLPYKLSKKKRRRRSKKGKSISKRKYKTLSGNIEIKGTIATHILEEAKKDIEKYKRNLLKNKSKHLEYDFTYKIYNNRDITALRKFSSKIKFSCYKEK